MRFYTPPMTRRAFTIVWIPALLVLVMVVLGAILAFNKPPSATGAAAYDAGNRLGSFIGPAVIGLFFLWLASRIAERRSETMATLIIGPILLLMNAAILVNVMGWAKPVQKPPRGSNITRLLGNQPNPQPTPQAAQPAAPRATPQPTGPRAVQPSATPPPPPAPVVPERVRPTTAAFDEAAAYAANSDAKAAEALGALAKTLGSAVADLEMKLATTADELLKPPVHDKRVLKIRREQAAALLESAKAAEKALGDAMDSAKSSLAAAGVASHQSLGMAIEFSSTSNATTRGFAAGDIVRFAEAAIEELDALDAAFPKWKLNADKEVDSTDFALRGRLRGLRMFTTVFGDRREDVVTRLRGE